LLARLREAERMRDQWAKLVLEATNDAAPGAPN
jgi:hypothetical protein